MKTVSEMTYEDIYGVSFQEYCENYTPEDAYQDAMDYEFNARYDYVHEAYGYEARMMQEDAEREAYIDACDAGFTGTYAEWKEAQRVRRNFEFYQSLDDELNDELPF